MRFLTCISVLAISPLATAGTAAGHPVPWEFAPAPGMGFLDGELSGAVEIDRCTGLQVVDFDVGLNQDIVLPPGPLCGLELVLDGPVVGSGHGGGGTFALELDVARIPIELDAGVDEVEDLELIRLAGPGWTNAVELGLAPQTHVVVDGQHALHGELVAEIVEDSTGE